MATQAIPREEWTKFFDRFSRDHYYENVTLELLSPDLGSQPVATEQVFRGISADEKDGENRIAVFVGKQVDEGTTHAVTAPEQVWLKEDQGTTAALEVRSYDGNTMLLRFEKPALPIVKDIGV